MLFFEMYDSPIEKHDTCTLHDFQILDSQTSINKICKHIQGIIALLKVFLQ